MDRFAFYLRAHQRNVACAFVWKTNLNKKGHFEWVLSVFCTNLIKPLLKVPTMLQVPVFCRYLCFLDSLKRRGAETERPAAGLYIFDCWKWFNIINHTAVTKTNGRINPARKNVFEKFNLDSTKDLRIYFCNSLKEILNSKENAAVKFISRRKRFELFLCFLEESGDKTESFRRSFRNLHTNKIIFCFLNMKWSWAGRAPE